MRAWLGSAPAHSADPTLLECCSEIVTNVQGRIERVKTFVQPTQHWLTLAGTTGWHTWDPTKPAGTPPTGGPGTGRLFAWRKIGGLRKLDEPSSMAPGVFARELAAASMRGLALNIGGHGDGCGDRCGDSKLAGDLMPDKRSWARSSPYLLLPAGIPSSICKGRTAGDLHRGRCRAPNGAHVPTKRRQATCLERLCSLRQLCEV